MYLYLLVPPQIVRFRLLVLLPPRRALKALPGLILRTIFFLRIQAHGRHHLVLDILQGVTLLALGDTRQVAVVLTEHHLQGLGRGRVWVRVTVRGGVR